MRVADKFSKGMIFALSGALTTSCLVVLSRYLLLRGENPLNLAVWFNLVTIIPWIFIFKKHTTEFKKLSTRNILLLIFIGIAGSIGINFLQALALSSTSAVNFAFLYRTVTVFTIIFAWIFLKEKLTFTKLLLVVFILIGSYFVTTHGQGFALARGDMFSLLMAASAAFIANILVKHTISKMHPNLSGSATSIIGGISLAVLSAITHVFKFPSLLMLIIVGGILNFALILFRNHAYKHATASYVTMIFALSPLFVAIISFFVLNERLENIQLFGGLIIITATILAEKHKI